MHLKRLLCLALLPLLLSGCFTAKERAALRAWREAGSPTVTADREYHYDAQGRVIGYSKKVQDKGGRE